MDGGIASHEKSKLFLQPAFPRIDPFERIISREMEDAAIELDLERKDRSPSSLIDQKDV